MMGVEQNLLKLDIIIQEDILAKGWKKMYEWAYILEKKNEILIFYMFWKIFGL